MSERRTDDRTPSDTDARAPDADRVPDGVVDADDTTQADAGMVGGTGAAPTEGTSSPFGTEPHDEDETGERKQ